MTNIDNEKRRKFVVFLDKNAVGREPSEETVIVEKGEDADEICGEVLDTMIANELSSGWDEVEEEP